MFDRPTLSPFKQTNSPLTPEQDRVTTFSIHRAGTERFLQRLVGAGLTLQPDGSFTDDALPAWSVQRARRWRTDLDQGLIARGLLMRLDGLATSVAVFASERGTLTSAVERAVGRLALARHPYLAVIADRQLERAPTYTRLFQSDIEPDAAAVTGLRSDLEVVAFLKTRL